LALSCTMVVFVCRDVASHSFSYNARAHTQLIDNLDRDLHFILEVEHVNPADVTNYDEVSRSLSHAFFPLRSAPRRRGRVTRPFSLASAVGILSRYARPSWPS